MLITYVVCTCIVVVYLIYASRRVAYALLFHRAYTIKITFGFKVQSNYEVTTAISFRKPRPQSVEK